MLSHHFDEYGFTLIELIITLVIAGIVATISSHLLTQPIEAYVDVTRRATLTDVAASALQRMQRDIQSALPNSIRISADGQTLELLHVVAGGRYRARYASDGSGDILDFTRPDTRADVIGHIANFSQINPDRDKLVIYPLPYAGANPYAGENITALRQPLSAQSLSFAPFQFPLASPQHRFFIIDTPITYHCDLSASTAKNKRLMRYEGYSIQASQPVPPTLGGAIQANYLSQCHFSYQSGSSTRADLVTLAITIADDTGESVRLLHQVHVSNAP